MSDKPIKAKPVFYSVAFAALQQIARDMGYNLVLHGSVDRDMDLIAIPWSDQPKSHIELLDAFCNHLGVLLPKDSDEFPDYMHRKLPGGRDSYVINLNRGGKFNQYIDAQYYLDISITPLIVQ